MKETIDVYASGVCACSVCTNITDIKKLTFLVNKKNPTGICSQWELSKNETFLDGSPHPNPCEQRQGFKHYLFHC